MTGILPRNALIYFASVIWRESQLVGWPYGAGRFVGELTSRAMLWKEEQDFTFYQTLPPTYYKMLKRLPLEERGEAYLWIIYQAVHPQAGLRLPPPGREHYFPKFMYDKLGTKPLGKVAVVFVPGRSSYYPAGLRVFPWPPITGTPWRYRSSSIGFVYPNCFDEDFDENSEIDDNNIGSPPPNSQPFRNLGLSPVVLSRIFLPPEDPDLGIVALHHTMTPWETSLTPRTRMWVDEFGYDLGKYGFYYVLPYYYDAGWGKGRMWRRSKGKVKCKPSVACRQEPGQPEPQGMRAPRPGTSVVRSALSTVVPTVDLLPFPLLALRRNLPPVQTKNLIVTILILCLLFRASKLAFRRKKGAPKLLRFILGMRLIQEPMDPLKTPMVSPNRCTRFRFPGIFSVIGLSLRCGGTVITI